MRHERLAGIADDSDWQARNDIEDIAEDIRHGNLRNTDMGPHTHRSLCCEAHDRAVL